MNTREKLIALVRDAKFDVDRICVERDWCEGCPAAYGEGDCKEAYIADHLISHGVTVQEWISVKDGLPKLIPCDAGTAYSEAVNVLTTGRKVLTAIWDGFDWICDAEFWDAEDEEITHWTPVLLPLPQPPKGE